MVDDGKIEVIHYKDHVGKVVPKNYIIQLQVKGEVVNMAYAGQNGAAAQMMLAIKSVGAIQIYGYSVIVNPRSFMSSATRDSSKSIGLLPDTVLDTF